jgi:predicted metalloprotease
MEWRDAERSSNVEDVRGRSFGRGRGMPVRLGGTGGMSIGGLLVLLVVGYMMGIDPLALLTGGVPTETAAPADAGPGDGIQDEGRHFIEATLRSTELVWGEVFRTQLRRQYQEPKLFIFSEVVPSACGTNTSAVGPFYCPPDQSVYIDLSFYRELDRRFGAPGDFAQAYVVAHEVGHHVQNLLGIDQRVRAAQQRASEAQANQLSVRVELQADCFAGIWGHYVARETGERKVRLNEGDIEEGLRAAAAIGDDAIQRKTQGRVSPESWTHGSSEQRAEWLRRGLQSGQVETCNTLGS